MVIGIQGIIQSIIIQGIPSIRVLHSYIISSFKRDIQGISQGFKGKRL
jgi:hypothetical protein